MMPSILVVDDQTPILDNFRALLEPIAGGADHALGAELDELERTLGSTDAAAAPVAAPSYRTCYVRQGLDAIAAVTEAGAAGMPFAVAFIDIHMPPGIDGIETAARLWEVQPDLEIVLCTAHSTYSWNDILARLPHRGQFVILRKPFDPIEVRQLAACLSEKWQRGRRVAEELAKLEEQVQCEVARRIALELGTAQRFEALGRLAAGIAHEINTPTQYVQSNLEFLGEAFDDLATGCADPQLAGDARNAISDALQGIQRLTTIVRSVRDYSHGGGGESCAVDLNRQVRMAAELARPEYRQFAELVLELDDIPAVQGFADELGRAVLNLLVNAVHAVKATKHRGTITIATRRRTGRIELVVSDTGVGIPPENQARVFEPFFTTKKLGEGTGQGLALVRKTIERHHGQIAIDSEVGRGTTFRITIPACG